MFRITKRMEIAGAHSLNLPYESKCKNLHGHNWIIEVEVEAEALNERGMVIDFSSIKDTVEQLDHQNFSEVFSFNPTAENIARWIAIGLQAKIERTRDEDSDESRVSKVTVQESEGNVACYIP